MTNATSTTTTTTVSVIENKTILDWLWKNANDYCQRGNDLEAYISGFMFVLKDAPNGLYDVIAYGNGERGGYVCISATAQGVLDKIQAKIAERSDIWA